MGPATDAHHHRNTTKVSHKPFKSKHSTKSLVKALLKGKVENGESGKRRTPHQQVMSKLDRRNQARQNQRKKYQAHVKASSIFNGRQGAPKIVAVVPLSADINVQATVKLLNSSLDIESYVPDMGLASVAVERFKQQLEYIVLQKQLVAVLDGCRMADFVLLILSAEHDVDVHGEQLLKAIESQGIPNVISVVQGLGNIEPPKRRPQVLSSLKSYIGHFLPDQSKLFSLDLRQDCTNVVRSISTTTPRGIRWREDRSWMLVEDVRWPSPEAITESHRSSAEPLVDVVLSGVVRGKGLKADRLVQLANWGVFQIEKITAVPIDSHKKAETENMATESKTEEGFLDQPTSDRDDMAELAPRELIMTDDDSALIPQPIADRKGVLLDDHHYFSEDNEHTLQPTKRLPKGTSSYQAAWLLDDDTDSSLESEEGIDHDGDLSMGQAGEAKTFDTMDDQSSQHFATEIAPSEAPPSEMFLDQSLDEEMEDLAAFRSRQKKEAQDDLEFPDEIELNPQVLARERLARYRGLKSLRTSSWEATEDQGHEPEDWHRLLQVANHKSSNNRARREALVGGVSPGTRVYVYVRNVPTSFRDNDISKNPICLYSLLRHEYKRTVVNVSITLDAEYPTVIKSKDELILQCGPRRLIIHPLFSQAGQTPNNVHKYDRYLHPGQTAVATFVGPVTWGPVPALFFKRSPGGNAMNIPGQDPASTDSLELIGRGTCLPPDPSRVIVKRVILTGHPYKIHKSLVTVRYMFFNAEDVKWFKALQLWTRRGRSGFIKESLGTHGYFKATFDGRINPQDAVCISLYKRVFPKPAEAWSPEQ